MQIYPKWKYHKTDAARVVASAEAEKALVGDWYNSPALIPSELPNDEPVEMNVGELRELLIDRGFAKENLQGKKKSELLQLLEGG